MDFPKFKSRTDDRKVQAFLVTSQDKNWLFGQDGDRRLEVKVSDDFLATHPHPVGGFLVRPAAAPGGALIIGADDRQEWWMKVLFEEEFTPDVGAEGFRNPDDDLDEPLGERPESCNLGEACESCT